MITVKNYQDNKNSVNWSKMPKAIQDSRNDVEEIMEFYDDDADIKETVDIFLKQINDNSKPVGEIVVGKLPKIKFVEPKTKAKIIKAKFVRLSDDNSALELYKGDNGIMYCKYKGEDEIYDMTDDGEPLSPVKNVIIEQKKAAVTKAQPKYNVGEVVYYKDLKLVDKIKSRKLTSGFDDNDTVKWFYELPKYGDIMVSEEMLQIATKEQINAYLKPITSSKSQPKPTKKVPTVVEKRYLDNYSTEFQLIKRFWNVIKDKKIVLEFRKAQLLYAAFNKATVERKVRKTSDAAEIFNACNQRMKKLFEEFMLPTQSDVRVDFDNAALYNKIQDYVANVTIDPTVGMLKRFISLQNTLPEIQKAETFLKSLQRTKEKYPDSRLSKELNDAIKALQDYIKNPKEPIEVESYGLSKPKIKPAVIKKKKLVQKEKVKPIKSVKIKGKSFKKKPTFVKKTVAKPVKKTKVVSKPVVVKKPVLMSKIKKPIAKLATPVVPLVDGHRIDEGKIKTIGKIKSINDTGREQNNFFTVNGEVGKFLQQVERKPFESVVITMDGMQGAGKTTTLYKFIDAFASAGNSSLFISGEEHPESSLAVEKRDKYLSSEAKKHTAIVGDVESVEQLYQYIKPYDIIFIDSWQKLQRMVGNIRLDEDLRKKFNGKVFVVIFQQTTTGRTKGGAEVVFDSDIIIKMVKEASFSENYAYFDKNRYTKIPIENIRYNIASGKTYNPNAQDEPVIKQPTLPVNYNSGFVFRT